MPYLESILTAVGLTLKLTMLGQRSEEAIESRTVRKRPDQHNCDLKLRNTTQVVVSVSRKSLQHL